MAYKQKGFTAFTRTERNTPILKKNLREGVNAEANNDGTIYIDKSIKKGTKKYKRAVNHELEHMNQMESGRANYTDNSVTWEGTAYPRKTGKIQYKGKWYPEGHQDLPWEAEAIKAENK